MRDQVPPREQRATEWSRDRLGLLGRVLGLLPLSGAGRNSREDVMKGRAGRLVSRRRRTTLISGMVVAVATLVAAVGAPVAHADVRRASAAGAAACDPM